MSWLAVFAVIAVWLLQQSDTQALLVLPGLAWGGLALLAWHCLGGRAAVLVLVSGWTLCRAGWLIDSRLPEQLAGHDLLVQGVVCEFPRSDSEALRLVLESGTVARREGLPGRLHLSWYVPAPVLQPGERWQLLVRLKPPHGFANPGGFDFEGWLYQRGIGASGYVRRSALNRRLESGGFTCPVGALRSALAARIETALAGRRGSGYVLGMTVGVTRGLAPEDWDLMRQTGTTHLLAISGFNIAMVAAPFVLLVPLAGRLWPRLAGRPGAGPVLATGVAMVYSALAGFGVSVVRALVMLGVVAALSWCRRRAGGFDVLAAAALVIVWIDPPAVLAAGFWLSFAGVAWLLVAATTSRPGASVPAPGFAWRGLVAGMTLLRVQLVLGLGLAPLTLAYFQQLALVAPLANLLAVPVFSFVAMPLALAGAALVLPLPALGVPLLRLAAAAVARLMDLLAGLASLAGGAWQPPPASALALALCALAALIMAWWRPLPLRLLACICLLPVLAGSGSAQRIPAGEFRVTVLDVGQGLAVLVQTASHALVYDTGPAFRLRDAGESVVVPVLQAARLRRLDALMISHDDMDHAGGAAAVLRAYPEARLIGETNTRPERIQPLPCVADESWTWDQVHFRVLSPPVDSALTGNDGSCVLRIDVPGASVLLPGDISRRQEDVLAGRGLLESADLVLAAHHGSKSSSGQAFVDVTRPQVVVFSTGYRNRWGFPAASVRERWLAAGACVVDTAEEGALVFAGSRHGLHLIHAERRDAAHLWTHAPPAAPACAVRTNP